MKDSSCSLFALGMIYLGLQSKSEFLQSSSFLHVERKTLPFFIEPTDDFKMLIQKGSTMLKKIHIFLLE